MAISEIAAALSLLNFRRPRVGFLSRDSSHSNTSGISIITTLLTNGQWLSNLVYGDLHQVVAVHYFLPIVRQSFPLTLSGDNPANISRRNP
jgi:hypothetical protein